MTGLPRVTAPLELATRATAWVVKLGNMVLYEVKSLPEEGTPQEPVPPVAGVKVRISWG